ncbi:MAG TPA: hypothetical protein PLF08_06060 [Bacillota bacterium]|jgi:phosphoenolpyruvate-protein kinase (PTS system EI component)|nr:hypothetical protein [Bacillota bacterium]HOQ03556.1 hypothetical protein [Bacillota bacterium]HPV13990.1 hypothetical protein [Bacillota bacterium]HPZ78673.1 hypothetical protein [Bacillota bacterium]HQD74734.1 hypothetical protein [Bacillota bacterium]
MRRKSSSFSSVVSWGSALGTQELSTVALTITRIAKTVMRKCFLDEALEAAEAAEEAEEAEEVEEAEEAEEAKGTGVFASLFVL